MVMTPPDRVGWQDERTRLLMADDDDMHCFDTMLMRATVFVEDACSGRSIEHRQDMSTLKLRRLYFSRPIQVALVLITLMNLSLVFYESPEGYALCDRIRKHDFVSVFLELLSLILMTVDAVFRLFITGKKFITTHPLELVYAVGTFLGLFGCILSTITLTFPAWHRLLRPIYLVIRWPDMALILSTLGLALRDVLPHILLLTVLNSASALMAMIIFPFDGRFSTFLKAVETLLMFTTGTNSLDIMLPPLNHTKASATFFVILSFLSTVIILGLVLATIYNRSMHHINQMAKEQIANRQTAFRLAFLCLDRVSVHVSNGLIDEVTMEALLKNVWEVDDRMIGLLLALLDKDGHGTINAQEFADLFELMLLKVERLHTKRTFIQQRFPSLFRFCCNGWSSTVADVVLVLNLIVLAIDITESPHNDTEYCTPYCGLYLSCAIVFLLEHCLTAVAIGFQKQFRKPLNFLVVIAIVIGQIDAVDGASKIIPLPLVRALLLFRILRLTRMMARFQLFRLIFTAIARTLAHLPGLIGVMLAAYYVFAMTGVALFKDRLGDNPVLVNTTYARNELQVLSFDTFGDACVVLWIMQLQFEIEAILDACRTVTSPWVIIYFAFWMLVSYLLILNVFFALLIDTVDTLINRPTQRQYYRVTPSGVTKLDVPTVEDIDADEESSRSSHKSNLQSSRASPTTSIQNQQQQHQEKEAQAGSRIIVCANGRPVRQTVNEFAIRCDSMRTAVAHRRMSAPVVYGVEYMPGLAAILGADDDEDSERDHDLALAEVAQRFGWHVRDVFGENALLANEARLTRLLEEI